MIFKYIGGNSSSPTADALWSSSDTLSENVIAALDTTSTYQGNYKNRIVQSWQTFNPQEVSPENIYTTPQRVRLSAPYFTNFLCNVNVFPQKWPVKINHWQLDFLGFFFLLDWGFHLMETCLQIVCYETLFQMMFIMFLKTNQAGTFLNCSCLFWKELRNRIK